MIAKWHENAAVLHAMLKLQSAMVLIAALVIYLLEARTLGKILAIIILFSVLSVVAFVHLQLRHERQRPAAVRPQQSH